MITLLLIFCLILSFKALKLITKIWIRTTVFLIEVLLALFVIALIL